MKRFAMVLALLAGFAGLAGMAAAADEVTLRPEAPMGDDGAPARRGRGPVRSARSAARTMRSTWR